MKKKIIITLLIILVLALAIGGAYLIDKNSITEKITSSGQSFSGSLNIKSVGQVVTFGKYEQDNNTANGAEDIEGFLALFE